MIDYAKLIVIRLADELLLFPLSIVKFQIKQTNKKRAILIARLCKCILVMMP